MKQIQTILRNTYCSLLTWCNFIFPDQIGEHKLNRYSGWKTLYCARFDLDHNLIFSGNSTMNICICIMYSQWINNTTFACTKYIVFKISFYVKKKKKSSDPPPPHPSPRLHVSHCIRIFCYVSHCPQEVYDPHGPTCMYDKSKDHSDRSSSLSSYLLNREGIGKKRSDW